MLFKLLESFLIIEDVWEDAVNVWEDAVRDTIMSN